MSESFDTFLRRREAASHAYIRGDASPLDSMLTSAEPATFFPPGGALISGSQLVHDAQVGGAAVFGPDGVGTFEIMASGSDHDLGFLSGRQVASVALAGGAPQDLTLRITEVFRREEGEWMLVHRHADVVDPVG